MNDKQAERLCSNAQQVFEVEGYPQGKYHLRYEYAGAIEYCYFGATLHADGIREHSGYGFEIGSWALYLHAKYDLSPDEIEELYSMNDEGKSWRKINDYVRSLAHD